MSGAKIEPKGGQTVDIGRGRPAQFVRWHLTRDGWVPEIVEGTLAETRRDVPLSQRNEGTPVPEELRAMVVALSERGWDNAMIQSETGLSRQAVSGVVSGARRRATRDRASA